MEEVNKLISKFQCDFLILRCILCILASRHMKLNRLLFLLSVLTITCNPGLLSQVPQRLNDLLVTRDWLEENRTDSLLVILHSGMKTEFKKEHIPGARYISTWDLVVDDEQGRKHEFPGEQQIEQVLRSQGINNNSKIIICYQDGNAIPWAARLFVTLDYAGLGNRAAMLNGGLKAWMEEGRPVTQGVTAFKEGTVDIQIRDEVRISKEEVLAMSDGYAAPEMRTDLFLPGKGGRLAVRSTVKGFLKTGKISEHDAFIAEKLAYVLTGGDKGGIMKPLDEQYLLDIEREAFVSLAGEPKTRARIEF